MISKQRQGLVTGWALVIVMMASGILGMILLSYQAQSEMSQRLEQNYQEQLHQVTPASQHFTNEPEIGNRP